MLFIQIPKIRLSLSTSKEGLITVNNSKNHIIQFQAGKNNEALEILQKSWDLRRENTLKFSFIICTRSRSSTGHGKAP